MLVFHHRLLSLTSALCLLAVSRVNSTDDACSTTPRRCTDDIPGVSNMLMGVDITTLDMLPYDNNFGIPEGFKDVLLDFTCNNGNTRLVGGAEYQQPDQVTCKTSTFIRNPFPTSHLIINCYLNLKPNIYK